MANKDSRLIKTGRKRNNWKDFFLSIWKALILTLIFAYTGSTMYYLGSLKERIDIDVSDLLAGDKDSTPYVDRNNKQTSQSGGGNSSNTNEDEVIKDEKEYIDKIIKLAGFDKHIAPYKFEKCVKANPNWDKSEKESSDSKKTNNSNNITNNGNNSDKEETKYVIKPWFISLLRIIKYTLSYSRSVYTNILRFVPGKNGKKAIPILILLPFVLLFYLVLGIPFISLASFFLGPFLDFTSFSISGMIIAILSFIFGPAAMTAICSGLWQIVFTILVTFLLPVLSNFRELLNIISNNYCLYTSLFGLLVVSSSFKFLKTEASLVMLVTYIYLLWKTCLKS